MGFVSLLLVSINRFRKSPRENIILTTRMAQDQLVAQIVNQSSVSIQPVSEFNPVNTLENLDARF
jgi:hypothetical protein